MEQITLGDIASVLAFVAALGGSIGVIVTALKKMFKKFTDKVSESLTARFDKQEAQLKEIKLDIGKNFLVPFLTRLDRGEKVDELEMERFWEQYEEYTRNGGNSYIKSRVEKLKASGRI